MAIVGLSDWELPVNTEVRLMELQFEEFPVQHRNWFSGLAHTATTAPWLVVVVSKVQMVE